MLGSSKLLVALFAFLAFAGGDAPPDAPKRPVVDTYHGVAISDDYRWLEEWSKPEVKAWSEAQNQYARKFLDALPDVAPIRARVTEVVSAQVPKSSDLIWRGGRLFQSRNTPPKQHPTIAVSTPTADSPGELRDLFDPTLFDPSGASAYDWFIPSPDGKLVAVSISQGGSEMGDVHLFDVESGKPVDVVITRVNGGTAGGDLEWAADSKGFYYTRYPRKGERPDDDLGGFVEVWYHQLGTPESSDRYELGKGFPKVAEIILDADLHGGRILASVQKGDGGEFAHHVRSADGKWTQITRFEDKVVQAAFGPNDDLILLSRDGAPRGKLLHLSLKEPELAKATTIVPEGRDTLMSSFLDEPPALIVTNDRIWCRCQLGGPSEIRAFDLTGRQVAGPPVEPLSTAAIATADGAGALWYSTTSYLEPLVWHRFDPKSGAEKKMVWSPAETRQAVDYSDCEVVREFATSKDGTKVPLNVIRPKGIALDGSHPCLLSGYGGYGMSRAPAFSPARHILLEQGVIVAEANLRGGGEFGEEWHRQGNLTRKQNVFDDFVACAQLLIEKKYTTPAHLAIEGGSNGGLLMGAAMIQHPELFKCVVSHVGIYDMLRVELSPNGAFNTTEFGTVKDKAQFEALAAYSPYHHVKDGTSYPAVLFLTGANDPRVDPMQSRKMTARLQAAVATAKSPAPVLLRTNSSSGHGMGTALGERIEQQVDVSAFLFHELGVTWKPSGPKKRTE